MKTAEDWLATYYPIPAYKVPENEALDHSILKFRGLQLDVLKEHGLHLDGGHVFKETHELVLTLDASACALCAFYAHSSNITECAYCPLARVREHYPCDTRKLVRVPAPGNPSVRDEVMSPWTSLTLCGDPKPMLDWLLKAKEELK